MNATEALEVAQGLLKHGTETLVAAIKKMYLHLGLLQFSFRVLKRRWLRLSNS